MADLIKLKNDTFFKGNFNLLKNDFTFIVDGDRYPTNKFLASLLSPKVSSLLSTDEALDSYMINTKYSRGNFQILLDIFRNREQEINCNHKEFLREVLEILGNECLQIEFNTNSANITYENVFTNLLNEVKYPHFYQEIIDKKISILSSNLYRILSNEEERQILSQLELEIIERILSNEKLLIESEDQLLEFINSLYEKNRESSFLYEYVDFVNCSSTSMQTFLNTFSVKNINEGIWNQLKERLEQPTPRNLKTLKRYHRIEFTKGSAEFDGIINCLRKQTNNHIENEIKAKSSSTYNNDEKESGPYNSIDYDSGKSFHSQNYQNSWISFEFLNHQIIPTHYTIQLRNSIYHHPLTFVIEGSLDKSEWFVIDRHNGAINGTCTFHIDENNQKEAKYIRLTQTGTNSNGQHFLVFQSIEFYGYLL